MPLRDLQPLGTAVFLAALALAVPARAANEPERPAHPPPATSPGAEPERQPPAPVIPPRPPDPDAVFSGRPPPPDDDDDDARPRRGWFDRGHRFVERLFFAPVVRLDEFFDDHTDLDAERSASYARFRNSLRVSDRSRPVYTPELTANLRLPAVDNLLERFRVVIAGAADDTLDALSGGSDATSPRFRDRGRPSAEVRFGAYRDIRQTLDVGAGLLAHLPVGAFARVRYRLAVPLDRLALSRSSYSVFWRTDTHLGTRLDSSLERHFGESTLLRLAGSAQIAQRRTRDLEYGSDLSLLRALDDTTAVAAGAGLSGATRAPVAIDQYRIFLRGRRAFLRRWLFAELEPEVSWPWRDQRGRIRELAVTFRLEVQLQGEEAVAASAAHRMERTRPFELGR